MQSFAASIAYRIEAGHSHPCFQSNRGGLLTARLKLLIESMNATKNIIMIAGVSTLATLTLVAAPPVVTVQVPAPAITMQTPAPPAVTIVATVPDTYIWDGDEYVGVVGSQYYYLGPGDVWLPFDAVRLARFNDCQKKHMDWRDHAIRNEKYRHDDHGHEAPLHDVHPAPPA
jgi:hypothetical protein